MKRIILPRPPGVNALYKITCRNGFPSMYKSDEGKAWIQEAGYKLKSQWREKMTEEPLILVIEVFYFGRFDIDSCLKPLLDLLQEMRVMKNDSQVQELIVSKFRVQEKNEQRVEVQIVPTHE